MAHRLPFSKEGNEYVEVGESDIHGRGVFAKTKIPAHTTIGLYTGRAITKKEFHAMGDAQSDYVLSLRQDDSKLIDGHPSYPESGWPSLINCARGTGKRNNVRFGRSGQIIVGARAIPEGREILIDYGSDYWINA